MEIIETDIPDVKLIAPKVFGDARGFFLESFREDRFAELIGEKVHFVQDNHSRSAKNVLRGLHFQEVNPQGKLVRVSSGAVYDVAVDLRKNSPTFLKWTGMLLSAENFHMAWIPPGFAHGFLVLSESADLLYKVTTYYHPQSDRSLLWNDPDLSIQWPLQGDPLLSEKDAKATTLKGILHEEAGAIAQ